MLPSYKENQQVSLHRNFYKCKGIKPELGDVIVFKHGGRKYLKRVLATENDTLSFQNKLLQINEKKTTVPVSTKAQKMLSLYKKVPNRSVLVIGDNYGDSKDSRDFGVIPVSAILGKVLDKN